MKAFTRFVAAGCLAALAFGMVGEVSAQVRARVDARADARANRANWRMYGSARPWFAGPRVRQELKIDDNAYNNLNRAYVQYWTPYNQAVVGVPADLEPAQRQQRIATAYGTFNTGFNKASAQVFTDPDVRNRYNQLHYQYQGYGAFQDPTIQTRLKLTDRQRQDFDRYYTDWNAQMNEYATDYATNPDRVNKAWADHWKQTRTRINETLTPEQRTTWNEMTGDPYEFTAEDYFAEGDVREGDRRDDAGRDNPRRTDPPRRDDPPRGDAGRDNPPRRDDPPARDNPPRRDDPPRGNPRDPAPRDPAPREPAPREPAPRENPPPRNP
jgi:hypothetical protein